MSVFALSQRALQSIHQVNHFASLRFRRTLRQGLVGKFGLDEFTQRRFKVVLERRGFEFVAIGPNQLLRHGELFFIDRGLLKVLVVVGGIAEFLLIAQQVHVEPW